MRELILQALRESVKAYPELVKYLDGNTKWAAGAISYKLGEAPDDDQRRKDERKIERTFKSFLRDQLERVIVEIKRDFSKSVFQPSFWSEEEMRMWDELSGVFIDVVMHGIDGAVYLLPDEGRDLINLSAIQRKVVDRALSYRKQWIKSVNENTMQKVWDRINNWRDTGDPIAELIKTLQEDPLLFTEARARRFAITETTRLNALGHQMTYEESGYIKQFKWQTANDERVCAICGANNGKLFPVNQLHELIPAHPNCRCWDTPIVDIEAFGETLDFTPEPGEWY